MLEGVVQVGLWDNQRITSTTVPTRHITFTTLTFSCWVSVISGPSFTS